MMGAVGTWLGLGHGVVALAGVLLAGGVLALVVAAARGRLRVLAENLAATGMLLMLSRRRVVSWRDALAYPNGEQSAASVPYGLAIFGGLAGAGAWLWLQHL